MSRSDAHRQPRRPAPQAHSMTAAAPYDHLGHPEPQSDTVTAAAGGHANHSEPRRESLIPFRGPRGPRCRPALEVNP
jgi:hypothetical protein